MPCCSSQRRYSSSILSGSVRGASISSTRKFSRRCSSRSRSCSLRWDWWNNLALPATTQNSATLSPAHQQRDFDRAKQNLADLRAYSLARQTPSQRLSTHILDWYLERAVEGEKYQWHNYPVNQMGGVQNGFPSFMANTHRLLARRDCEYYLRRLNALPTKFDQLLESLRVREQKQILPPRFVVERVLKEMTDFAAQPAAENILASSFKTRVAKIKELTDAERADFQNTGGGGGNEGGLSGVPETD